MNANSLSTTNAGAGRRLGAALARWIQRWNDAIDAAPLTSRHRIGAWEASASFSAQAARQAMQVRKLDE